MNVSQFSLEGKVALVTGGSRGIGKAAAIGFAKAGADVAIASRDTPGRGLPTLEDAAAEIAKLGRKSMAIPAHVGHTEQIQPLVDKVVAKFGRIDILVNAAGTSMHTPVFGGDEKQWDAVMNLNLKGLFFLSQAVAKVMKDHGGGAIINVASIFGFKPEFEVGFYSIAKAGVIMATKVLAQELAKYKIRANVIAPGLTQTRMLEARWAITSKEEALKEIPLARFGEPADIANSMIYLASDAGSYVTGQAIAVDGGFLIY
ncbi:MAG: glucose 1-dehydrogenase [Dehalococcoidales bacterium]|nr:glucose 1-dehydrogenase [Dehalococcoidales bacterium]